jgi:hypothetical protein
MKKTPALKNQDRKAIAKKLLFFSPILGLVWTSILFFTGVHETWSWFLWASISITGCSIGLLGFFSITLGNLICSVWFILLTFIDKLIIWTVLPIFFYLILSPYSILIRMFRKNSFQEVKKSKLSYWHDAESAKTAERYLRQF